MIHDTRQFGIGLALIAVFLGGLVAMFSPLFANGGNVLDHLDGVFNSISKASAYYIPAAADRARKLEGRAVSAEVSAKSPAQAAEMEKLLRAAGASVDVRGTKLAIAGDLGRILGAALSDADAMFKNDAGAVSARYGLDGRRALFAWHTALGEASRDLTRQGKFQDASAIRDGLTKGLEPAYNYYGVTAIPMKSMLGIALAALVGYVIYTVWYGFAILFLFEGWGLNLEH